MNHRWPNPNLFADESPTKDTNWPLYGNTTSVIRYLVYYSGDFYPLLMKFKVAEPIDEPLSLDPMERVNHFCIDLIRTVDRAMDFG
jgi:hypothetical protein